MTKNFASSVKPADFFILRTAAQSVQALRDWQGEDRQTLIDQLKDWLSQDDVKEALYIASPSLVDRIHYWHKDPDSKQGKKVEAALVKYFTRMTSRSTPFGLFAGLGCGKISETSHLDLDESTKIQRNSRIDMGFLATLQESLLKDPKIYNKLPLSPNQSLYKMGEQWRFIESTTKKNSRQYRLSNAQSDCFLDSVLNNAKGKLTAGELAKLLCDEDDEIELEDAVEYITSLIEEQLLIPNLPLNITGDCPNQQFSDTLLKLGLTEQHTILQQGIDDIAKLDEDGHNAGEDYQAIIDNLKALVPDLSRDKLFQVDYFQANDQLALSKNVTQALLKDLAKLDRLKTKSKGNTKLKDYIRKFNNRYEGQAVSLSQLLDDEMGLTLQSNTGYESPLIGTLPFKDTPDTRASADLKWSRLDSLLMDKVIAASASGASEIEITDKDIKDFPENSIAGMPHSFSTLCSLYANSNEDLDSGKFSARLSSFGGSTAGSMLGRFCHLDEGLRNNVRNLLEDEQTSNPEAVYAEVVHLPQGRIGNVIARPVLREYEIPFLTSSGVDEEHQINIDDLWVFVAYSRVVIWSKRLKKEVIPRLSSAHNYSAHALSVYHFLCSLQSQTYRFCGFGWSGAFGKLDYLPRVRLGHLICAPQLWRLSSDLWLAFKKVSAADFATKMAAFRQKYKLPQWILYSVGDNNLQVNLANPVAVQTFLNELKKDQTITVEEVLSESFKLAAQTKGQPVEHELLLPMVCHHDKPSGSVRSVKPPFNFEQKATGTRQHIPGGQWLMLKIYTGNTTSDYLLRDKIAPLLKEVLQQASVKSWFFMRFGDPDWHIRLRFNAAPEVLYGTLMPQLNALLQPLYQQGLVNKVEVVTYEQELERYGGEQCMALSEKMFQHDSQACLSLLQLLEEQPADVRWQATLLGCDYLVKDFGLNTEACHQLFKSQRDNFAKEFNETSVLRKEMGKKYRLHETHLQQILLSEEQPQLWQAIHQVFAQRSKDTIEVIASIRELEQARKLCINVEMLIRSYLHMFMNRMFVSNARQQELLVYEFLNRVYDFAKFRR